MLGIAKKIVISLLQKSDDERLRNFAGWIKDAEQKAVDTVLAIITDGVKNDGGISPATAERILGVSAQSPNTSAAGASHPAQPGDKFLEQYLDIIRLIATFGYWGKALCLQGFLHTNECSSLWLFENGVTPELSIKKITGPSEIEYRNFKILIGGKLKDEEFRSQNYQIGNNYTTWIKTVDRGSMQEVVGLYEDSIELQRTVIETGKGRRSKQKETVAKDVIPFANRVNGVQSLAESLPIAVEERKASFTSMGKAWKG